MKTWNTTKEVRQAASWLKAGRLLAYPTESVWGIGCDPFNEAAVRQILAIKKRPIEKGMIVVTDEVSRIEALWSVLDAEKQHTLFNSWSKSPLSAADGQAHTWLLPVSGELRVSIPAWVRGEHESIAVRVISHPLIKSLCREMVSEYNPYGFLVSTSCNPSGLEPAKSFSEAYEYFSDEVGYLLGETLGYQLPSQIHDAMTGRLIR